MEECIDLDSDNICGICNAEFLDIDDLKLHITQYHLHEASKHRFCKFCSSIFPDIASFALHIRNSHLSSLKVCKHCTRVYNDRHSLSRHEKKHKSTFYYPKISCSQCIRVFKNKKELENHEYEKHRDSEDGLMLQYCFPELSSLININIRKFFQGMNENYFYRCVICDLSTPNVQEYINHLIINKCESLACNVCCNVYPWKSRLESHCKSHKENKETINSGNEKCPKCDKYFYSTKLKAHLKECTSMKCIPCDVAFDTVDKFAEHVSSHSHRTPVQFENCKYCRRPFIGLKSLQQHIEKSHKHNMHLYKYRCIYCDIIFKHPKLLFGHYFTKHRDINPYSCKICKKDFRIRKNFTLHIKLDHKSVGFVEFDSNYHVFFTNQKSEKPFQPKNPDVDDSKDKKPEEVSLTKNKTTTVIAIKCDDDENKPEDNKKQSEKLKAKIVTDNPKKVTENVNNTSNETSEIINKINLVKKTTEEQKIVDKVDASKTFNNLPDNSISKISKESKTDKVLEINNDKMQCDKNKEIKTNETNIDKMPCENNEKIAINEMNSDAIQDENKEGIRLTEMSNDTISEISTTQTKNNEKTKNIAVSNDTTQCENNEEIKINETSNDKMQCENNEEIIINELSNETTQFKDNQETDRNLTDNNTLKSTNIEETTIMLSVSNEEATVNETTDDKKQSKIDEPSINLVNVNSDFMTFTETEADQTENDTKRKGRLTKRKIKVQNTQPRKRRKVKSKNDPNSSDSDVPLSKIVHKTKRNRKVKKRKTKTIKDVPSNRKKTKFICFKCDRNCYTYQNYHRHMSLHMKKSHKMCVKCFGKFKTKEQLNSHMKTEHSTSKLTETLKKLLDKRKSNVKAEEPIVLESPISKTIQKIPFKPNSSQATITRVDNDKLSVKKFLETFKPDTTENTKKISISNSLSIRPVTNERAEPLIKMNKFKPEAIVTERPQLRMPVKFREEIMEEHNVTIKLVHCEYVAPAINFDYEVTVSDFENTDNIEGSDQTKSDLIPEVGHEVLLDNSDTNKVKLLTKTIVLKDLLSYNNVRIGHLAPKAPYYKIVKIDDVLQEKQEKVEPQKPIDITLPNGTKLVSVNPLAHLLGNKSVADIPKSNPYKNKPYSYKPKTKDFREAIVKAMKVLDKIPPKRKNSKNVNTES